MRASPLPVVPTAAGDPPTPGGTPRCRGGREQEQLALQARLSAVSIEASLGNGGKTAEPAIMSATAT